MAPFQWKNCFADVQASHHDLTIESYLTDVVLPALATLRGKIGALGRSDNPGDEFAKADTEDLLKQIKSAFALSIQSIWERQLRACLTACAGELRPDETLGGKVAKADWEGLCKLFGQLHRIALRDFPSFAVLDLLQDVGNACRHGDGKSASALYQRAPDLWPNYAPLPEGYGAPTVPLSVALMDIPVEQLEAFVAAIAGFWIDVGYIYAESIEHKHEYLEARLVQERLTRAWRPQAQTTRHDP